MPHPAIAPDNTVFVIYSFEGPDGYSLAGGLGVRVDGLSRTLALMGFPVHLFFIGDPRLREEEALLKGRLILHRWCQWISAYYPRGVYEGENEKLHDFNDSLPWYVSESVVRPAVKEGKMVVVLGEEWHTAEAISRTSDLLHARGHRDRAVMFWNANNTFGFDRINWGRLSYTSTITTVSRYMKHIMWKQGVNPLVIPNGIPSDMLGQVDAGMTRRLRRSTGPGILLSKVARYHPDKNWHPAVETMGRLKARGERSVLLARGGIEPHGSEVMSRARAVGLSTRDVYAGGENSDDYLRAIQEARGADYLNLTFRCPQQFLRVVYHASDAVLANSGHEPFGLVGLEAMAAGGVAFTGSTGEDYALHLRNSVVLDTADPREMETYIDYLVAHPEMSQRIRNAGRETASQHTWNQVAANLLRQLGRQAGAQGLLREPAGVAAAVGVPAAARLPPPVAAPRRVQERALLLAGSV